MNQTDLKHILSARFNLDAWKPILNQMFPQVEYFINGVDSHTSSAKEILAIKNGGQIGTARLSDGRSLAVFQFEVADSVHIGRNRKSLREIAAQYVDQSLIHGALVFYYSNNQDDYRLTYIAKQSFFNENGEFIKKETAPKRYTFLLGINEPCTTAASRILELIDKNNSGSVTLADVTEAFSVERLNKEFFSEYKKHYQTFLATLSDEKRNRDYVKKLLGRLVFLQFLQKKGWMGVPATCSTWEGGNRNYLQDLIKRYKGNSRLLSDILEPLFFKTLNTERPNDLAPSILGENIRIPYLNGGLFEQDAIDQLQIDFSYDLFANLVEFFGQYNFTIDENDPEDSEIGIDPEMLGHIFENLLEDNKDKGAFYTPKEIVQYMCRQSIIQYLKTHEPREDYAEAITLLINSGVVDPVLQNKEVARRITSLLENVKVCDPAIGSGAFPMGIMSVLFHARHALQAFADSKGDWNAAEVKRDIIQNNIYGVDIEQGAVDIARLRFWLSLVVDEKTPQPLPNLDYKIMCGNSLLNRYSLDIPLDDVFVEYNKAHTDNPMSLNKYKELVQDFTNESNHCEKKKLRDVIEEIKKAFRTICSNKDWAVVQRIGKELSSLNAPLLFGSLDTKHQKRINELQAQYADKQAELNNIQNNQLYASAFEWRFEFPALLDEQGHFIGFDIVIGNPPYLRIQGIRNSNPLFADELTKKYKSATGSFDLYATFAERGLQLINNQGIVNYIMPIKWTNAAFGKGLRTLVAERQAAHMIISFGAYQVFNASTYTALQWFKPNSEELTYYELNRDLATNHDLEAYLKSLTETQAAEIKAEKLTKAPWVLTVGSTTALLARLEQHPRRIGDIFSKIFQGLATSKDDVYFLYDCKEDGRLVQGYSKQLDRLISIERGLVKPLLKGEDVHRYDHISTDRFVIVPYKIENDKAVLYTENELIELFPQGYSYLKECETVLRDREKGRLRNDAFWFRYIYPKNLALFEHEKLVAPDISMGGNFAYDEKGLFYQTTTVYGYIKKREIKESYKFWMALFNSRLFWWFLTNTGTVLANGFFRFKPDYIKPFPVPAAIPAETEQAITILVEYILTLKALSEKEKIDEYVDNDVIIRQFERIIDALILELYFNTEFQNAGIEYTRFVIRDFTPLNQNTTTPNALQTIANAFAKFREVKNEINNNLKYMQVALKDLYPILNA